MAAVDGFRQNSKRFVVSLQDYHPPSPDNDSGKAHEPNNNNGTVHVLVTAHPDDESMFFLPTLTNLNKAGETVWLVCLTTGNYDGLGDTRKAELSRVCRLLHIHRLVQVQVEALQDHPTRPWDLNVVTAEIERALVCALRKDEEQQAASGSTCRSIQRMILITFDFHGVSGHINHRDTYLGVRNLIYQQQKGTEGNRSGKEREDKRTMLPPLEAWKLETVHLLPYKYLPIGAWLRLCLCMLYLWEPTYLPLPNHTLFQTTNGSEAEKEMPDKATTTEHVFRSVNCALSWKAMATHQSQWVWYRRLFVIFSCYTFVNKLRPVQ